MNENGKNKNKRAPQEDENHRLDLRIPENNWRIRASIPTPNLSLHSQISSLVDLSHKQSNWRKKTLER
jgi:hypothetical protein